LKLLLSRLTIPAALCLLAPQLVHTQETQTAGLTLLSQELQTAMVENAPLGTSQMPETDIAPGTDIGIDADTPAQTVATATEPVKSAPERELIFEGLASYGNYNLFAKEDMTKLYTSGVEYDRHSWGYFLRARMDYVAEVLPFVLLVEPAVSDYWGDPLSHNRKLVPGVGITPIGLRMLWRSNTNLKPYMLVKGGMLGFTQKVLSPSASYENFSLQSGFGVQARLNQRWDLRLGLWGDFHFSNGFIVPSNPGTDVMNASWGLSYHLR
jgi:hypothetical protein